MITTNFKTIELIFFFLIYGGAQPSECGRQRTLNIVYAQTAAQQQL